MRRRTVVSGFVSLATGLVLGCRRAVAASTEAFTPEAFGARGDGRTNDTAAFRRMADAVNLAGGGRIVLRPTRYLVGEQRPGLLGERYAFAPSPILQLKGCTRPVVIEGNGATLRCAPGLRYGTFDRVTGRRIDLPMPNTTPGPLATPYDYMVLIERCSGSVSVADLELDGSVQSLRIGGQWGDTGWQIAAVGLFMTDNTGAETVRNVHSHHHAQDGMMLRSGPYTPGNPLRSFTDVRCELNGRQGCSLIGGGGYTFNGCRFAETGMVQLASAPGAGFDIEAEGAPIRNIRFADCEFTGNFGCGLVADSGDSADIRFDACRFVGTANWSAWPRKPFTRFTRCSFVGPIVQCWGDDDPARATQFHRCTFRDTAALPLQGRPQVSPGPIANLSEGRNVLFSGCNFTVTHGWALPWSLQSIYENCTMKQIKGDQGYPRGTYRGSSTIDGNVDLASSRLIGTVTINGVRRPK